MNCGVKYQKYMRMKYLRKLSLQILSCAPDGVSKVKFAKIIYFTFKEMVKNTDAKKNELAFIRMPLGPVPKGFYNLGAEHDISIRNKASGYLIYNTEIYSSKSKDFSGKKISPNIQKVITSLLRQSTSKLVEASHKDYSWKNHSNGDEYFIENRDLINTYPKRRVAIDDEIDQQKLQAKLMEGMLEEIVDGTTSLEYPNFKD